VSSASGQWSRPDELDALVASPEHHQLLLENERVSGRLRAALTVSTPPTSRER
jgi:hypothetical protein